MKPITFAFASACLSLFYTACVAEAEATYLDRVESPVFEATGDHQAITKRAITCITQVVKPGFTTAPTITSSDPEAGTVVANNAFVYYYGPLLPVEFRARTTLTFQAKDGRFRIVHTNIEKFNDTKGLSIGWERIGTWRFSGGEEAKQAIDAISQSVATCVMAPAPANDDW
jgi:hypothetical protein